MFWESSLGLASHGASLLLGSKNRFLCDGLQGEFAPTIPITKKSYCINNGKFIFIFNFNCFDKEKKKKKFSLFSQL